MKHESKSPETQRFNEALRQVVSVSKTEMNLMLAAEKARNADKPKRGPKPKRSSAAVSSPSSKRKG